MVEPITVGALVAKAVAFGAAELAKGALSQVATDAYTGLKLLLGWAQADVASVEAKPDSQDRQGILAEKVEGCPPAKQEQLRALAQALIDALSKQDTAPLVDTRFKVIAGRDAYTAGRDQHFGAAPPATGLSED